MNERRVSVTSPAPPEVIIKRKQELGSLSGEERLDQFHLKRYSKVLQARSKEMSSGKEQMDLLRSSASKTDQPITTFLAKKTCGAPKVQAPTAKPLLSTLSDPASILHSTNGAIIESQVHASNIIGQLLSTEFVSWLKSC